MKCFFRLLGGCLVFCGAIWIISCVYAAVFLASPLYALFAVPGAGPIWLGVWLCRRFWVKFERNREQKRRAWEEQKRKTLEEQRLQDQRDAKERRRQKLLADAGLLEPERREWISRLERASAAFSSRMLYGARPNYARDTEVDEVSWDWDCFAVSAAADLNEILEVSDSLMVMHNGRIAAYFENAKSVSEDELGEYMLGVKHMSDEEIQEAMYRA